MSEENMKCPSCGAAYDNENLIVCLNCGSELHSVTYSEPSKKYNIFTAYKAMFTKIFDFRTRSSRREYWFAYLANAIVLTVFALLMVGVELVGAVNLEQTGNVSEMYDNVLKAIEYVYLVYNFVVLIPQLSLTVRRLHDTDRSGMLACLEFLAPIGTLALMLFLVKGGSPGPNRYGPAP